MFLRPDHPGIDNFYRYYLGTLTSFPGLQWRISSINGSLALGLHRRALLDDTHMAESRGNLSTPPASRLIDVLGVRSFSFNNEIDTPGFTLMFSNPERNLLIYRNEYAKPKLRSYFAAEWVRNPDEAVVRVTKVSPDTIVIESKSPQVGTDLDLCQQGDVSTRIERREFSPQYYKIAVESPCPGWLYLSHAYYPGWSVLVDGVPAELYPAQVLGKAVKIPQGNTVLGFVYRAQSFYIGAIVSGVAWLAVYLFILWRGCVFFLANSKSFSGGSV